MQLLKYEEVNMVYQRQKKTNGSEHNGWVETQNGNCRLLSGLWEVGVLKTMWFSSELNLMVLLRSGNCFHWVSVRKWFI